MTGQIHPLLPRDGSVVMFMMVRDAEGRAMGYPMTGMLRDGTLEITSYRKAPKVRHLLADDRVCCVVQDPAAPGRGVAVYGHAVPASADGFVATTRSTQSAAITVPDEVRDTVRDRLESDKRMVFRIEVVRVQEVGDGQA